MDSEGLHLCKDVSEPEPWSKQNDWDAFVARSLIWYVIAIKRKYGTVYEPWELSVTGWRHGGADMMPVTAMPYAGVPIVL